MFVGWKLLVRNRCTHTACHWDKKTGPLSADHWQHVGTLHLTVNGLVSICGILILVLLLNVQQWTDFSDVTDTVVEHSSHLLTCCAVLLGLAPVESISQHLRKCCTRTPWLGGQPLG